MDRCRFLFSPFHTTYVHNSVEIGATAKRRGPSFKEGLQRCALEQLLACHDRIFPPGLGGFMDTKYMCVRGGDVCCYQLESEIRHLRMKWRLPLETRHLLAYHVFSAVAQFA